VAVAGGCLRRGGHDEYSNARMRFVGRRPRVSVARRANRAEIGPDLLRGPVAGIYDGWVEVWTAGMSAAVRYYTAGYSS